MKPTFSNQEIFEANQNILENGYFVTIKDFINRYQDADLLKLFFLSAHYSHPIDYTEDRIKEAKQALERITILIDKIKNKLSAIRYPLSAKENDEIEEIKHKFIAAMDDDFNTPQGLACVFELVNLANKNIEDKDFIFSAKGALKEMLVILGINLTADKQIAGINDDEIKQKISERESARKNKNFALSDKIRKELEAKGIILEDTKNSVTTWRRKI